MEQSAIIDKTVMVVEDNFEIQSIIKEALELDDYKVITAENGLEALTLLEHKTIPDLILLDLMMPIMNGWEFAAKIKESSQFKNIPIIVISAFVEKANTIECNAFIEKPVDFTLLLNMAGQMTGRSGHES